MAAKRTTTTAVPLTRLHYLARKRYLLQDEADELEQLAAELNVHVAWRWLDLRTGEWHEGRRRYDTLP